MKTTIDRAGRVVIPKSLRDQAGFKPGTEVEIRFTEGNIEIAPPAPKGRLVRKGSVLVWDVPGGPQISQEEINRIIEEVRNERGLIEGRPGY